MIVKLGLNGAEQDLVQDSLTLSNVAAQDTSSQTRSANGTLHIDYKPVKRSFTLNYDIISKSDYKDLEALYDLQVSSLQNLNYIIEEGTTLKVYQVQMLPVSRGDDMRDKQFYYSVSIDLVEV